MFRKITIALVATTALGAAALAPSAASAAHFGHGGHGFGHGFGHGHFGGHWHGGLAIGLYSPIVVGSDCYVVRRVVDTPVGPRVRRMEVCG